ncbi:MAG TPA: MDR family MFS transporter [Anaerolineaceae bacterium]|nr:MDR family MFS transporter [Anaerolineaceae bacterium]
MENPTSTTWDSQPAAQGTGRRLKGFALFSVLAALMLTLLLEALDQTVVGTAMPRIIASLNGFDLYTWVVTAYLLASVTMVPIVGKLSDQFGRKWFLITGASVFLLGSILSGAATSMTELIAFRALQGLGSGIGIALVFTVIGDIFPPAERARWQGVFGVVYGVSNFLGPTLGGFLTDHGPLLGTLVTDATRWRWVFYVNVPIALLAVLALLIYLPADISQRTSTYLGWAAIRRIDFLGAILVASAAITLLLGLTWGGNAIYAWNSAQVIGILAAAAVLFGLFFIQERRALEPVLPLDLFRNRVFSMALLLSFLQLVVLIGLIIYLPLFLQGVLGISPTNSGAAITPLTVSSVIGGTIASILVARFLRYQAVTIIGAVVLTAGIFLLTTISTTISVPTMIIFMVIAGLGIAPFFTVLQLAAQNAIRRSQLGAGTAAVRFVGQIGAVIGIAVVGTVVNQTLASDILTRVPAQTVQQMTPAGFKVATDPQILINTSYRDSVVQNAQKFAVQGAAQHGQVSAAVSAQISQQVQQSLNQVFDALKTSLTVAIQHGLIVILAFAILMILASLFLKDIPLKNQWEARPAESGQAKANEASWPGSGETNPSARPQVAGADPIDPPETGK